jgi:serine/threonine-protein kinase
LHFVVKGIAKDPADRYQTAEEMIDELQAIREGRCRVSCPATLAKRMTSGVGRFVNHYPKLSPFIFYSILLFFICYVAFTAHLLVARAI